MNRRDFLRSEHAWRPAGQLLGAMHELNQLESEPVQHEFALLHASRRAMGTDFEVLLPYGIPHALAAAESALNEVDCLEQQLTVYRETSEVSRLNRVAPLAPVPVERRLYELLALARSITEETLGAYDITTGALIKAWQKHRAAGRFPSVEERTEALSQVGMQHVILAPEQCSVRYLKPGLKIDLGSIGKGYAVDRVAEVLRRDWNLTAALLHGGHSSVYAMGTEPGNGRGWTIGIRHPWDPERRLALVWLRDRGLGTSAATFQYLEHQGRKLGHILDPRTGWPAEGIASVTVLAPTGAQADALATAFFILGLERTREYCDRHPDIGAIVLPESEPTPVVFGLGADEVSVLPD